MGEDVFDTIFGMTAHEFRNFHVSLSLHFSVPCFLSDVLCFSFLSVNLGSLER